jgi:hypothetical protein
MVGQLIAAVYDIVAGPQFPADYADVPTFRLEQFPEGFQVLFLLL